MDLDKATPYICLSKTCRHDFFYIGHILLCPSCENSGLEIITDEDWIDALKEMAKLDT